MNNIFTFLTALGFNSNSELTQILGASIVVLGLSLTLSAICSSILGLFNKS